MRDISFRRNFTMRSMILEIKDRLDIGRQLFNVSLSRDVFLRSGVTMDCLKRMSKMPVDRERFTMVFIIGQMVAETCIWRKVGIRSRSHCLLGEAKV